VRKIGVLVTDGFDATLLAALRRAAKAEKAVLAVIAPKVGGATDNTGKLLEADFPLSAGPSFFFDAAVILATEEGAADLATQAAARDWVSDAFGHLKYLGHTTGAQPLLDRAGVKPDAGVISLTNLKAIAKFVSAAKKGRVWEREPNLRQPG
jgi:catalase